MEIRDRVDTQVKRTLIDLSIRVRLAFLQRPLLFSHQEST